MASPDIPVNSPAEDDELTRRDVMLIVAGGFAAVGGTMAPGASGFADLQASVMRLMELPSETRVHPGHREPTTIGEEWEQNPFVRIWRGLDSTGEDQVTVWGRPATLKLWAPDYDGGHKAWITFNDSGEEAIVGGSQVER